MIKPLSEQTLMNNYVFTMVMREPRRIKPLLEYILQKKIKSIRIIEREKVLQEKYESKSIRLDLFVEDSEGTIYDVEVQTTDKKNLGKRMRYYQGLMDISFFPKGTDYRKLKKSYVIFICNYDPYKQGRAIYTFQNWCDQDKMLLMGDKTTKVVVNTQGYEDKHITPELREVLHYLDDETVTGEYSRELNDAVQALIHNEERGAEYMTLMTYGDEQRVAGEYIGKVKQIRRWYHKKVNTPAEIMADANGITLLTFKNILSLIKEHPDWDDSAISDEVDWELVED